MRGAEALQHCIVLFLFYLLWRWAILLFENKFQLLKKDHSHYRVYLFCIHYLVQHYFIWWSFIRCLTTGNLTLQSVTFSRMVWDAKAELLTSSRCPNWAANCRDLDRFAWVFISMRRTIRSYRMTATTKQKTIAVSRLVTVKTVKGFPDTSASLYTTNVIQFLLCFFQGTGFYKSLLRRPQV